MYNLSIAKNGTKRKKTGVRRTIRYIFCLNMFKLIECDLCDNIRAISYPTTSKGTGKTSSARKISEDINLQFGSIGHQKVQIRVN